MVSARRWQVSVYLSAALLAGGCRVAEPVPEFDETPAITILITPEVLPPISTVVPPDSGLHATLVTTGTPFRSPYLHADRFEMRRLSDGALFAWRFVEPPLDAIGVFPPAFGNYFLPRQPDATGLGSDSIARGGVYELVVEAGRHRIVGRTRVPGPVEFVREPADGDSIVRWRRAAGAARYDLGGVYFGPLRRIADTAFVVHRSRAIPGEPAPPPTVIRVFALDSNYAVFRSDFRASQAGITGGWGLFGSVTWADTELPPPAATAMPR
jgi:hypothetical protein